MYKFVPEAFNEVFTDENIDALVNFYNKLDYNIKKLTPIYTNSSQRYDISHHNYKHFKQKYEELLVNNIFSDYFVELVFNSLVDIDVFDADVSVIPEFYVLQLGNERIILKSMDCFQAKPMTNFNDIDILKMQNSIGGFIDTTANSDGVHFDMLSTEEKPKKTLNSTIQHKQELQKLKEEYDDKKKAIKEEQHKELETLKKEKDRILEEMEQKKQSLLAEMHTKELELQKKMHELKKEMSIMDAQIYDIQSYLGETYEIISVRSGKKAPLDQPFTINQKIRFLDEDLPIIIGLYGKDFNENNYDNLIQAFKYSDKLVDYFCQTDKSMTFFRLSRKAEVIMGFESKRENKDNRGRDADFFVKQIANEKGHDFVGFVLKNGECLHFGVLDNGKRVIVDEDVFCDITAPEQTLAFNQMSEKQATEYKKKQAKDRLARKFMFSLIQGLIDNKKFITFYEPVNVFTMPPQIIFSSASGRIETKRFGEFEWLKKKLNLMTRTGDHVFVHNKINDANRMKAYFNSFQPSIDEIFGLRSIEKVEFNNKGKQIFIKTTREAIAWDSEDVNSNIEVYQREFINIEYMNSKWVDYFISIKAVDQSDQGHYFPIMIKNWMVIRDFLLKREDLEREKISEYYPGIDNVLDWPVKLSEWKLQQKNPVRNITDYQAKRFAKALTNNEIKDIPFMYAEDYAVLVEKRVITSPEHELDTDLATIAENVNKQVKNMIREAQKQPEKIKEHFDKAVKDQISLETIKDLKFKSDIITETLYCEIYDYGFSKALNRIDEAEVTKENDNFFFTPSWSIDKRDLSEFKVTLSSEITNREEILFNFFANEITRFKKTFDYDLIGNRDFVAKTINQLRNVIKTGIKSATDDDHIELIQALLEIETLPDFRCNYDFNSIRDATTARSNMSPQAKAERERLINASADRIGVSFSIGKGYYDSFLVFDKNDLERIYFHSYLNFMRFKYNLAIDAINSFPYFRTVSRHQR